MSRAPWREGDHVCPRCACALAYGRTPDVDECDCSCHVTARRLLGVAPVRENVTPLRRRRRR